MKYDPPPAGNANFALVQHIVYNLAPAGVAGFVLANGSTTSQHLDEVGPRLQLGDGECT